MVITYQPYRLLLHLLFLEFFPMAVKISLDISVCGILGEVCGHWEEMSYVLQHSINCDQY